MQQQQQAAHAYYYAQWPHMHPYHPQQIQIAHMASAAAAHGQHGHPPQQYALMQLQLQQQQMVAAAAASWHQRMIASSVHPMYNQRIPIAVASTITTAAAAAVATSDPSSSTTVVPNSTVTPISPLPTVASNTLLPPPPPPSTGATAPVTQTQGDTTPSASAFTPVTKKSVRTSTRTAAEISSTTSRPVTSNRNPRKRKGRENIDAAATDTYDDDDTSSALDALCDEDNDVLLEANVASDHAHNRNSDENMVSPPAGSASALYQQHLAACAARTGAGAPLLHASQDAPIASTARNARRIGTDRRRRAKLTDHLDQLRNVIIQHGQAAQSYDQVAVLCAAIELMHTFERTIQQQLELLHSHESVSSDMQKRLAVFERNETAVAAVAAAASSKGRDASEVRHTRKRTKRVVVGSAHQTDTLIVPNTKEREESDDAMARLVQAIDDERVTVYS